MYCTYFTFLNINICTLWKRIKQYKQHKDNVTKNDRRHSKGWETIIFWYVPTLAVLN